MDHAALHEQVERLESKIEELTESSARCHKIAVAARIAIGAGAVLFAAILLRLIYAEALPLIIAAIFAIGGIVLYGSNQTTANQIAARIAEAERLRAELISEMELTLVLEPSRLLH
jgi:hypothetical protein